MKISRSACCRIQNHILAVFTRMVGVLLPVAAAALKVVEEKPQERTTSSTSVGSDIVSDVLV